MNQDSRTIALISPGDMGHAVAEVLIAHGACVITCLDGRSERTKKLAAKAGIVAVADYATLVREADMLLSILVPAEAVAAAQRVADALSATGADLLYVDCNAIAPQTVRQIETIITQAGGRFADASIIGPPPRKPGATRFYASGTDAAEFAQLNDFGLTVMVLDGPAGQASGLKMCYGAVTKGFTALCTEVLTAAHALGVADPLVAEFQHSQALFWERMAGGLPGMTPKARRWVGEMEEIAATFAHVGMTPQILAGAADMYRLVGETELADRTPEDKSAPPTATEIAARLAAQATHAHNA